MKVTDELVDAVMGRDEDERRVVGRWFDSSEMRFALTEALSDLPEPIDLTQLPAYIELQKRLVLAEARLEAVRKYVEDDSFDSFYRKHLLPILDDQ